MSSSEYTDGLSLQDQLKLMDQAVRDIQTSRYIVAAAVTCVLYDILLTMNQERSLIWPARWSFGKILYFMARYPVTIHEILWLVYAIDLKASEPFCKFEAYLGIWSPSIFLIPLQVVVVLRVIAVWDGRRSIAIFLWSSLIAADAVILVTMARIMHEFSYSMDQFLRPLLGCQSGVLSLSPTISVPAWVAIIAFDTVLFVLTLVKGVHSYRYTRTRLLTVLIRDGFAYYCIMLALSVSNLTVLTTLSLKRDGLLTALTSVIRCSYPIISSRIVLNLRGAASSFHHDRERPAKVQDGGVRLVDMERSGERERQGEGEGEGEGERSQQSTTLVQSSQSEILEIPKIIISVESENRGGGEDRGEGRRRVRPLPPIPVESPYCSLNA